MTTYYMETQGITYRIVAYLGRDKYYETYHGRSTKPLRNIILHLPRKGRCQLYPKAPKVESVQFSSPESQGTAAKQLLPWRLKDEEPGLFKKE